MKKRIISLVMALFIMAGAVLPDCGFNPVELFTIEAEAAEEIGVPRNVKAKVSGSKVTLTWDKVEGADAYRVYRYNSSTKKYTKVKNVAGNKAVITGLSSGTQRFKVAALVKVDGKYKAGKASSAVKAKISSKTAIDVANEMGNGWNLGNTMEAMVPTWISNPTVKDTETAWQPFVTTKAAIDGIKDAGFGSVRVPVAWSNFMSTDGKYTISEDYFNRVDEIVGYVLDNDMYCIINIHWDGGWWSDFGSRKEETQKKAMEKYTAMWTQIAEHYKDYSDKLIFESANEELGGDNFKLLGVAKSYEKVNEINQKFVDIVRKSGGKNGERFLLIAGVNTNIKKTCSSKFVMPKDTVKNHLLVSVHYYDPPTYCLVDDPNNSWGYMASWGTKEDIAEMEKSLSEMKKFTDQGYGVIIGEYGVCRDKKNGKYTEKKGTDTFVESMLEICDKYGFCPMLWDIGDFYDRSKCKFKNEKIAALFK